MIHYSKMHPLVLLQYDYRSVLVTLGLLMRVQCLAATCTLCATHVVGLTLPSFTAIIWTLVTLPLLSNSMHFLSVVDQIRFSECRKLEFSRQWDMCMWLDLDPDRSGIATHTTCKHDRLCPQDGDTADHGSFVQCVPSAPNATCSRLAKPWRSYGVDAGQAC